MNRISNPVMFWMQALWPVLAFAMIMLVVYQVQTNATNVTELVILVATIVVWRRVFGTDPFEVLEGNGALLVKKGRRAIRVPYKQIQKVEVKGGRLNVQTDVADLASFSFLPINTSWLSTGRSRKEALKGFANELRARLTCG